ncbi:hypothetical protein D0869_13584 [Hortaea werneckii]|uniref:ferric-chelate reductase (NADPH) n=1 Tax=Hortaea werneckii TaxID=91943 RepID=A0A3M6XTP5_HORWE|nr:hypothetical protein KC334_g7284 [Hortaea werneckii]KAI7007914.1 hypothetical protein KC355_g7151 [Hortaea werneckii]KAI7183474.1 hypothetical protein KC324_g7945 [Hortaea werneckii]KAI7581938.1 hypothetical protein KC316_g8148 [Hortaea werneckii]KAI7669026.1 hypothetical protein KC318_g4921 [Hortaea werneckii]
MGYYFQDLTTEQKAQRRDLLDWYGLVAQLSVLAPLLALQLYFFAIWTKKRWENANELETPSSPYAKARGEGTSRDTLSFMRRIQSGFSRFVWWSGDSVDVLGYHLGAKGDVLFAACWACWLLFLCFPQTGEDYMHLAKRFGAIGASQLPLQYLLALKSPYSPVQLLTRSSHETLNALHQHLGYIITGLFYAHVGLYLNFYVVKDLLVAKLQAGYILAGVFSIIAFTTVGTTALAPVRKWSYRVFYFVHVALASLLLPVLFLHVAHIRVYIYETAIVYAANAALRFWNTQTCPGTIRLIPNTRLIEIIVQPPQETLRKWCPGQHVYVSLAGHPFLRTFKSNPFTIASLPSIDGHIRVVAKILDGNTARLAQIATDDRKGANLDSQPISLEGPYGVASHSDRLLQYDRILFVAGGVGATFILPLYRQLLADLSPSSGSYRRQKVDFVWVARERAEVVWAMPDEVKEREAFRERLTVYLTGRDGDAVGSGAGREDDGIELTERETLLAGDGEDGESSGFELDAQVGRPDLRTIVDRTFAHGMAEKVAVVVCGPAGLDDSLRRAVGRHVEQGRDVWYWEERFAF